MEVPKPHPEKMVSEWLSPIFVEGILPVSQQGDRVHFTKDFSPSLYFAFLKGNRAIKLMEQIIPENSRPCHVFTELGRKVRDAIYRLQQTQPEIVKFFTHQKKTYRLKLIRLIRLINQSANQHPMTQNEIRVLYRRFRLTSQLFKSWIEKMQENHIFGLINEDPNRIMISIECQAFITAFTQETQNLDPAQASPNQITQQELNDLISNSLDRILLYKMQNFAIASVEGLPIHSSLQPDISEIHISALTAVTFSICERLCYNLNFGEIEFVLMSDADHNHVVVQRQKDFITFVHYQDPGFSIADFKQIVPSIANSWYYFITSDGITTDISNFFSINDEPLRTHMIQLATQHNTSERIFTELKSPSAAKCVTLIKGTKGAVILGLTSTLVTESYQRGFLGQMMGTELDMVAGIMTSDPNTIEDHNFRAIEMECKKLLESMEEY